MYESFFGLEKSPFSLSPDPRFLYAAPRLGEAFAGLLHGVVNRRGFVVLTGESGTGKSTLLRALLSEIGTRKVATSLIFNPLVKPEEFLELAMLDFGLTDLPPSKPQRLARFNQFLMDNYNEGVTSVLFVDEAHTMTPALLEEIRLLANFETSDAKLLQIVLAGHSELDELLERHELRQLKQRIAVRVSLQALRPQDVGPYMRYRWRKAGSKKEMAFTKEAIAAVAYFSQGIPRSINALADNALLQIFGAGKSMVDAQVVAETARDLRMQGPAAAAAAAASAERPAEPAAVTDEPLFGLPVAAAAKPGLAKHDPALPVDEELFPAGPSGSGIAPSRLPQPAGPVTAASPTTPRPTSEVVAGIVSKLRKVSPREA
jgi:general secretion pathway protein A